ncbi:E3 SUMO-protein ligase NSE2 [Manduca sexta]|uniref:E3 SUMO-protein ligase NSE2 n=1 Tax=Manduca sexta TaxID=7130 RepID=A0A921Z8V8_MANSE|nr:E3 SUMO-protein ligase NSE2 [Manduca sexta]KAG6453522.1 hypothetical protein O3G_MSEX008198 [Manduca sexta]
MSDVDLAELRKQCITSLYLCTDNISKYLDKDKDAEFKKLQNCVKKYCLLEAQQEVAVQALEKAKRETNTSNIDTLEERFNQQLNSLANKRNKPDHHPYMLELKKRYQIGNQRAKQNLDESDLAITESQNEYLDPITKRPVTDPVRNSMCGHIYDRESIMSLINMRNKTKCPVVGCGNNLPVLKQHLISDDELKFRLTLTQHSTMIQEPNIMDLDNTIEEL